MRLRVATYNVHKCRGLDRRIRPDRILCVLAALGADVIALQEVLSDQAGFLARGLGFEMAMGENRRIRDVAYGNAVLSRFPLRMHCNYDLTAGRERRGCLHTEVLCGSGLHVYNVHLGTGFRERRRQACLLLTQLAEADSGRIILGDFNEWTRGLTSRLLAGRVRAAGRRAYPGLFPVLHLDHIYYDPSLELERLTLHRSPLALLASDHLPLAADFQTF